MQIKVNGTKLLIEVDISPATLASAPLSSTGKNKLVASTHGMRPVEGHPTLRLGLNVITK
jgi:hypothetical protein